MCALLFLSPPLPQPPPLQEPSGWMSVRIKKALRPQSSECCQQVNSPSLIALYPPLPPTHPTPAKKGKVFYRCRRLWAISDGVMKMSQWGKVILTTYNSFFCYFCKCRLESTEEPVVDYCIFRSLLLRRPSGNIQKAAGIEGDAG